MLLDKMLDNRKTSTSKLLITGIILVSALVILGTLGYFFNIFDSVQITKQENFYGISGKILEVSSNSIIIETPVIPFNGSSPSPNNRWIWNVSINDSTEIVSVTSHEDIPDTQEGETPPSAEAVIAMTINDLRVDDPITVTSSTDIKKQFSFDDKQMTASKIEVY